MSANLASLKSDAAFKANLKKMKVIEANIQAFNENLDYSNMVNTLTGRAKTIAIDVQNNIIPKLKKQGSGIQIALAASTASLKAFSANMVSSANVMKTLTASTPNATIQGYLTSLQSSIKVAETMIAKLLSELDLYHSAVNSLISDFNSEKIELSNENNEVKKDEQKIIDKLNEQTHTVCGVIKTVVNALTFQLEGQLKKVKEDMAQLQYRYNINLVAIHSTDGLSTTVQSYLGLVEQAKSFWGSLDSNVIVVSQDTKDLISDPSSWDIGWQGIQDDWQEVLKLIDA